MKAERNDDYGNFSSNVLTFISEVWDLDKIYLSRPHNTSITMNQDNYINYLNPEKNAFEVSLQGGNILGSNSAVVIKEFGMNYTLEYHYSNKPSLIEDKSIYLTMNITSLSLFSISPYENTNLSYDEDLIGVVITIKEASLKATINDFTDEEKLALPHIITYNFGIKPNSQGISFADPSPEGCIEQGSIEGLDEINLEFNEEEEPIINIKPVEPVYINRDDSTMAPILQSSTPSSFIEMEQINDFVKLKFKNVGNSYVILKYKHGKMIGNIFTPDSYNTPDSNELKCYYKTWKISDFSSDKADNFTFTINQQTWASNMNIVTFTGGDLLGDITDKSLRVYIEQEGNMIKDGVIIPVTREKVSDDIKTFSIDGKSSYEEFYQDIFETQKITEYSLRIIITAEKNKNSKIYKKSKSINIIIKIAEQKPESNYLKMFTATVGDPEYISLNDIKNNYPKYDNYFYNRDDNSEANFNFGGSLGIVKIKKPFYEGRNNISPVYDNPAITTVATDLYYAKLFKLAQDSRNNNLSLPEIDDYNTAMTYMTGINISNIIQQHEIFLTYHTGTPNIVKPSWGTQYKTMLGVSDYLPKNIKFVFDWISWASTNAATERQAAGYASGPGFWPYGHTFIGHVQLEKYNGESILDSDHGGLCVKPKQWRHVNTSGDWAPWGTNYRTWAIEKPTQTDAVATGGFAIPNIDINLDLQKALSIAQLVIHESGHAVCAYRNVMDSSKSRAGYSQEWLSIGGWTKGDGNWYDDNYPNPDEGKPYSRTQNLCTKYITEWTGTYEPSPTPYGCTHPLDDFAESYAIYIFMPEFLKKYYPKRFNYLETYMPTVIKQDY